ncbi:MAG: hemagglutinin repeat-containing protein, partial [Betaproteobacteria bacterium]|nr:hemagglutinin repeat-containing protein [Betaproteobacteria bacterium]
YVEVAGSRAQVVIANPAGISCDGCGFINANRVTLTTGTAVMNGGDLEKFLVNGGTIFIVGDGLDASRADFTDIIARAVKVNAGIWAKDLKVTAGTNSVSADHRQITPIRREGEDSAPPVGIDVAALGGMYAGKIVLVGTGSGVGVRNAGQIGASVGEVTITADGQLVNSGQISASTDVHAETNGGIDNSGTIYAKGNTKLNTSGNVGNTGTIAAQGNTSIAGTNVESDANSVIAAGVQGDGALGGSGDVQVSATGLLTALGQNLAGGDLSLTGSAINVSGSQTAANNISINAGNNVDASRATIASDGTLQVTAQTAWFDHGQIAADRLRFDAAMLSNRNGLLLQTGTGPAVVRVLTKLDNTGGTLSSNGSADITAGELVNRDGVITAGNALQVQTSGALDNTRGLLAANRNTIITAGSVNNTEGSIGSVQTNVDVTATTGAIDNTSGWLEAAQTVTLNTHGLLNADGVVFGQDVQVDTRSQTLDNTQGVVVASDTLGMQTGQVTNDDGMFQAGKSLNLASASLTGDGQLLSLGDMNLSFTGDFTNTGEVLANGNVTLKTDALLVNKGELMAGGTLTLTAQNLNNTASGEINAFYSYLNVADTLINRGLIDGALTYIDTGTLNNLGTGRIYGDFLALQAGTLNNDKEGDTAAVIAARARLDMGVGTLNNREHALIFSAGDMAIGGALDEDFRATGSAEVVNNNSAWIDILGNLVLVTERLNNTNEHFSLGTEQSASERIVEYQGSGSPNRYTLDEPYVYIYSNESDHLCTPEVRQCVEAMDKFIDDMNKGKTWIRHPSPSHGYEEWKKYDYTRTTSTEVITESDPGMITSGGAMHIEAGAVFNDKSHIIAGGVITGTIGDLDNTEVEGQKKVVDTGTVTSYWRKQKKGRDETGSSSTRYTPPALISQIDLTPTKFEQNTAPNDSGTQIVERAIGSVAPITEISTITDGLPQVVRSSDVNTTLPNSSLFNLNPNPTGNYVIETDPRFADYRTWLSSDYMLAQLGLDMAAMQKRLGDGFYEQKLIREQIAQLTGRRFLDGYADDEAQYQALIDNALLVAEQLNLIPGVALTAEQMAQLTSDIVWLVEREVTLPDGQTTRALVPQVYVLVQPGDLDGSGSLIAGQSVGLNLTGDLLNQGNIVGRNVVSINAENINNLGGRISGNDVLVQANTDLNNIGGTIDAASSLAAIAGGDLNVTSTTHANSNAHGSNNNLSRVAGLYVTAPSGGVLLASAGHNVNLDGAYIVNASADGQTYIEAQNDLNLGTVEVSQSNSIRWDSKNWREDSTRQEVGTNIQAQGDIVLSAGNDLNARGASVRSEEGAVVAIAANDVNLTAAETTYEVEEAHKHKGKSSWLASKTITTLDTLNETVRQGATLSGNETYVQAGHDLNVLGSNVVSTSATTLAAENDVNIEAATGNYEKGNYREEKKSGLFSSGGIGFTIGVQKQSVDQQTEGNTASVSTVGSTHGDVTIHAGNHYQQTGSNVLAPKGDIDIEARKVDIVEAREDSHSVHRTKFRQSGLTVALTSPIISLIQTADQMNNASKQTDDDRMKALAGVTTALAAKNAADAVATSGSATGGINISITVGASSSDSKTTTDTSLASGSTVAAGGDVTIRASGAGEESDITLQGSQVKGGENVMLHADDEINLLAAGSASEMHRKSSSASGGVGVALNLGSDGVAFGIHVNASGSRGRGEGTDVGWTNTHVSAGETLTLESGGDTNLIGAVASGEQVVAKVGGDLNIESLQDTSEYKSKDQSIGGSVTIGYGFSASVNVGQDKMDSDYASVQEQSGIRAGDGGFQIEVEGNTDLKGAVIASTDRAVEEGVNSLTTGTLTTSGIENHAEYSASSVNLGFGYTSEDYSLMKPDGSRATPAQDKTTSGVGANQQGNAATGGDMVPGSEQPSYNGYSATMPMVMSASGEASSVTTSGISGGVINITNEAKQKEITGKDAEQTLAGLDRSVSSEQDSANALKPIFNEQEIKAGFEIVGALQREVGTFLNNRAKEIDKKNEEAKKAEEMAMDENLPKEVRLALIDQAAALRAEARAISNDWGAGGAYRQIVTALIAGVSGNVTGSTAQFAQNMVVNYVQQQGAEYIGKLVVEGTVKEGSPEHAALHAIVACAGMAGSNQSCGAGAAGAAASSLLTGLFSETHPDETASERQAKANLITSLVTGIAMMSGIDTTAAANSAVAAVDNNWLATQQVVQYKKERDEAKTQLEELAVDAKWIGISFAQDAITARGFAAGLVEGIGGDVIGIVKFLASPIESLEALKKIIAEEDVRAQLGEALYKELNDKIDKMSFALEYGGRENAFELGRQAGEIVWHVGSAVLVVKGAVTASVKLADAGIKIGINGIEALATNTAKLENVAAKGGMPGKLVGSIDNLTAAEQSFVREMVAGGRT